MGYITGCMTVEDCWCDGNGLLAITTYRLAVNTLWFTLTAALACECGCVGLRIRLRWLTQPYLFFVNSLFGELKSLFGILISLFSSNKKGICCVVWRHHICHPAFDTELIWKPWEVCSCIILNVLFSVRGFTLSRQKVICYHKG